MSQRISLVVVILFLSPLAIAHIEISAADANDLIQNREGLYLVDIREDYEYCGDLEHIPGALLYPWSSGYLYAHFEDFPLDAPILIYCRSGNRSHFASNFLDNEGYTEVYDMLGGIREWRAQGLDTVGCVDTDGDLINDDLDNCPLVQNSGQEDADDDGTGNVCDMDCPLLDGSDPVTYEDFRVVAEQYGLQGQGLSADLDNDMDVDQQDVNKLAVYWLSSCQPTVP